MQNKEIQWSEEAHNIHACRELELYIEIFEDITNVISNG